MPNKLANLALDRWNNYFGYLLCGLSIPKDNKTLLDPNIWIEDTVASVHMMAHKEGLQGLRKAMQVETITMGDGGIETNKKIGTLSGTIYDQFGNKSNKIVIVEVSYLPNSTFKLFSLTQTITKGWIMGGTGFCFGLPDIPRKLSSS
jgi:hypothetical protein